MALGILTAGFLKGAADGVTEAIGAAQEAERKRQERLEERQYQTEVRKDQQRFQAGQSALTRQFQREEALAAAADLEVREQAQRAQRMDEIKLTQRLATEEQVFQDLENEIYLRELQKQIGSGTYDATKPLAYDPRRANLYMPSTKGKGTTTVMNPMYTKKGPDGEPIIVSLPDIDYEGPDSKEVLDTLWGDFTQTVGPDLPRLIKLHRDDTDKEPLENVMGHLSRFGRSKITAALQMPTTNDKNAGEILYRNPITYFGIDQLLPNKQDQKYFYETFFSKVVPEISGEVKQALGIHPDVDIGITQDGEGRPVIDLPRNVEALTWATDGSGRIKPVFADLLPKVAQYSKVPVEAVLRTFYVPGTSDAQKAQMMKEVLQIRDELTGTYIDRPNGRMTFRAGFGDVIGDVFRNTYVSEDGASIAQSIERGIDLATILLPPPKLQATGLISVQTTPRPDYQNKYYLGKYGVDRQAAAQKAGFAQDTIRLIADIRQAQKDGGLIGATGVMITTITGVEGVFKGLADILTRMKNSGVQMGPGAEAKLRELEAQGSSIIDAKQATAQGVTNYLIEALAFAIAGSLQGGAKGNNISNQDIQNVKSGLNMGKLFSSEAVAKGTLDYLEKKMTATYTINRKFAEAQTEQDFRSVYIYNSLMNHSYDKDLHGTGYDFFTREKEQIPTWKDDLPPADTSDAATQGGADQPVERPGLKNLLLGG